MRLLRRANTTYAATPITAIAQAIARMAAGC
nr:MAG TPA: hypothetical protein [Caudoviricetes sp.]